MNRVPSNLIPKVYKDFVEMEELFKVQDSIFKNYHKAKKEMHDNQFVVTANEYGISEYEKLFKILPNPSIESLEFRRDRIINRMSMTPPFSFRFLQQKFNEIIGAGKWRAYIDFDNYTLYVESSAENQVWANEITITISTLKPANIVFTNKPLITQNVEISEKLVYNTLIKNYRLGVSFILGNKPFVSYGSEEVLKLPNVNSIKEITLNKLAHAMSSFVHSILINDTLTINSFNVKPVNENIFEFEYAINKGSIDSITNVKVLSESSEVLSEVLVFVPVIDDMVVKHTMFIEEGGNS